MRDWNAKLSQEISCSYIVFVAKVLNLVQTFKKHCFADLVKLFFINSVKKARSDLHNLLNLFSSYWKLNHIEENYHK